MNIESSVMNTHKGFCFKVRTTTWSANCKSRRIKQQKDGRQETEDERQETKDK